MKARLIAAIALIALGILGLTYQGITYTTREVVLDAGPVRVEANKEHTIPITPIVSGIALAGGVALLIIGRTANRT